MKIASLDKLLEDELKDVYNAEGQLVKALPRVPRPHRMRRRKRHLPVISQRRRARSIG